MSNQEIRAYLASIGSKGGKISRRTLTPEQAKAMVRAREKKRRATKRALRRSNAALSGTKEKLVNKPDVTEELASGNVSAPARGSAPPLPNKFVALEGRLEMERHPYHPPISCDKNCRMDMKPFLCGIAHRKDGAANVIVMLESLLEGFNGKYVRITFETEALNDQAHRSAERKP